MRSQPMLQQRQQLLPPLPPTPTRHPTRRLPRLPETARPRGGLCGAATRDRRGVRAAIADGAKSKGKLTACPSTSFGAGALRKDIAATEDTDSRNMGSTKTHYTHRISRDNGGKYTKYVTVCFLLRPSTRKGTAAPLVPLAINSVALSHCIVFLHRSGPRACAFLAA